MQNYTEISPSMKISASLGAILDNDKTAISNNAGSAFPTTNLIVGMQCFREDESKLYQLVAVEPAQWELVTDLSDVVAEIETKLAKESNLSDLANAATARANLGLGSVNNTSDANKPVSTPALLRFGGATTTAGVLDWNDSTNTKPGIGPVLLLGSHTNGPGFGQYFFVWNLEYGSGRNGDGNITQIAVPYNNQGSINGGCFAFRGRYSGVWTAWERTFSTVKPPTIAEIPGLTAALSEKIEASQKGAANGVAPLDADAKIPAIHLPSYVDDVLEFDTVPEFPASGESGKIYVDKSANAQYRWSGTGYVEISPSPGSTDAVPEGATNKYFTAARVREVVLDGLSATANAAIAATDSVIDAFGKLQAQIVALGITIAEKQDALGYTPVDRAAPVIDRYVQIRNDGASYLQGQNSDGSANTWYVGKGGEESDDISFHSYTHNTSFTLKSDRVESNRHYYVGTNRVYHSGEFTDAATPSTPMMRNSSGDVWARLFRSTYATTNGSITHIYTGTGTIGSDYIRPSTPAQVKAALAIAWGDVGGKPTTFAPAAHNHSWGNITSGVPATATRWPTWSEVSSKPSTFTPAAHTQSIRWTGSEYTLAVNGSAGTKRLPSNYVCVGVVMAGTYGETFGSMLGRQVEAY